MKRLGENLIAYSEVKEANLRSLYTVWLQAHGILGKAKLWRQLNRSVFAKSSQGIDE